MRRILILYLSIGIGLLQSCKTIPIGDSISKSIKSSYYVFNFDKRGVTPGVTPIDSIVYHNKNLLVLSKRNAHYNYDPGFFKKEFYFIKKKDTMIVFCECGPSTNYYFKEIDFRKGSYIIKSDSSHYNIHIPNIFQEVKGADIKAHKKVQKILFKEYLLLSRNPGLNKKELIRKDVFFEDLKFNVIDLSDTVDVKLEPMSKKEFWDNQFFPKTVKK